jgi:hypothetical protein
MEEQFEKYRKTIEQMSEEEIEAARAMFGGVPPMQAPPGMPPRAYGYGPQGGYPGMGAPSGEPGAMGQAPMMPPYGAPAPEQGPPQPQGPAD